MTNDLGKAQPASLLGALDGAPRNPASRDAALRALSRAAGRLGLTAEAVLAAAPDLLEGRLDAAAWRARLLAAGPAVPPAPEAQDVGPADATPPCVTSGEQVAASLPAAPPAATSPGVLATENTALRMRVAELEQRLAAGGRPKRAPRQPGPTVPREGTKQAQVIAMLRRPDGATLAQITEGTGWQPHTARAMLSAAIARKLGLPVTSAKDGQAPRVYRITG